MRLFQFSSVLLLSLLGELNAQALYEEIRNYPPQECFISYAIVSKIEKNGSVVEVTFAPDENVSGKGWAWESGIWLSRRLDEGQTFRKRPDFKKWIWVEEEGPVPIAEEMLVKVATDRRGNILSWLYYTKIGHDRYAFRQAQDGSFEGIFLSSRDQFLWLRPHKISASFDCVKWTQKHGLVMSDFYEGGDASDWETETADMRRRGWPIANIPGERVLPGRNGWKRWTVLSPGASNAWSHQHENNPLIYVGSVEGSLEFPDIVPEKQVLSLGEQHDYNSSKEVTSLNEANAIYTRAHKDMSKVYDHLMSISTRAQQEKLKFEQEEWQEGVEEESAQAGSNFPAKSDIVSRVVKTDLTRNRTYELKKRID